MLFLHDAFGIPCVLTVGGCQLVDIAPDGTQTPLHDDPAALGRDREAWFAFLGEWTEAHGVPQ